MDGPILWRAVQRRTATASGRLAALHALAALFFHLRFYSWLACVDTLGKGAKTALHGFVPRQRLT